VAPSQQLQPTNFLKHPDYKIQHKKQTPTKKNSIGKVTTTSKEKKINQPKYLTLCDLSTALC
jgi:hypothetical protein